MAFTETLKLAIKRKAHFSCCLCHSLDVEVHHIIPESEDGPDTYDNAAPLCPSCHETYGANPQKRKFIREARDFWYELCDRRYASDAGRLDRVLKIVQRSASKDDISEAISKIEELEGLVNRSLSASLERERYIEQIDRMQQRVQEIESELQTKSLTLSQLRKREAVTQIGAQITVHMANVRKEELDQRATDAYGQAIGLLIRMSGISSETFMQIFGDAFRNGPVPEDANQKLLYYLSLQYKSIIGFVTSISIASSVVPTILEEFDKNPDQPINELQKILAARIRAGDLDLGSDQSDVKKQITEVSEHSNKDGSSDELGSKP